MAFDDKKAHKEFYLLSRTPRIVIVTAMAEYAKAQGDEEDFGEGRFHHKIYLSDMRRCQPEG